MPYESRTAREGWRWRRTKGDVGRDQLFGRGEKDDDVGVEKPDSGGRWMVGRRDGRTDGWSVTERGRLDGIRKTKRKKR